MRSTLGSRIYKSGLLLVAGVLIAIVNCDQVDVTTVDASRIELSPPTPSVAVSQTIQLTASVLSSEGQVLTGRTIEWTSLATSIASVDNNGMVRGLSAGSAQIRASSGSASGTTTVTVTAAPTISFAPTEVTFNAVQNGSTPGDRQVGVSNAGSGTLSGLTATVRYTAGQPTGWLSATLNGTTAPTTLVLSANQASLAPGTYTATVDVTSGTTTAPLTVRLTVLSPAQAIALSTTTVSFAAAQGGASPVTQAVGVTNAGGGALTGLATAIVYTTGQPTGWLTASLSGTTAPATLTLGAATGTLPVGTHTASVRVTSPVAQNSPQTISVSFTIGGAQPTIALNPRTLTFVGARGSVSPAPQQVQVTNVGGAALTGIVTSVTYPGGQASGWLTTQLSSTTAPATVTVGATTGGLPNGIYTATLGVSLPAAMNSPQLVDITFQVVEPPPSVPTALVATTISPSQINLSWTAAIGLVERYRIERRTGASGTFAVIDSVTPGTTTYQSTGLTSSTLYTYRVQACNASGCSSYSNEAAATTAMLAPSAPSGLTASAVSASQINLGWTAATGTVASYRIERKTGAAGTFAVIDSVTGGTLAYQSTGLAPGTQYGYRVQACNPVGCSPFTTEASATTGQIAPGTPAGLTATAISPSQINLAWTASTGSVDRYRIERKTGAAGTYAVVDSVAGSVTAYQNTIGLTPATQYFYRIQACNAVGCSGYSTEASATTTQVPPGTPTSLVATAFSSSQINLTWAASTGTVVSYRIERKTGAGAFAQIDTVPGSTTSYSSLGLTPATLYDYQVRACNAGGCSAYSTSASATTRPAPPGAPSAFVATTASSSQINLSWAASTGIVDSYRIERKTGAAAFAEIISVTPTTLTYADLGLTAATLYDYQVRACNTGGCSSYSTPASATTQPLAPSALVATSISSTQIDLSWAAPAGVVTSYRVERSTTTGSGFAEIATVNTTTYQSTGLNPSTQYFYRVRACNAGGCGSLYTAEANATTKPPPPGAPSGLTATVISPSRIDLSWSTAPGLVDTYRVERSTTTGTGFVEIASINVTTYQSIGLNASTQYFYRVRACNTGGCSAYTAEVSGTTHPPIPGIPSPPSNLIAAAVGPTQIDLSWTASLGTIDTYRIERRTTGGTFAEISSIPGTSPTFSDVGVTGATGYEYQVRACNAGGCSPYSNTASAATPAPVPGSPSGLSATAVSTTQIDLSWSASSGAVTNYRVERSTTSGTGFVEIASVGGTTYQSTGLTPSTQYFYRVRSCNNTGCSAYTSQASATTQAPLPPPPGAPSNLVATPASSTKIDLTWNAATGTVSNYRVERSTTSGTGFVEIASIAGTSYPDAGLSPSTQYFYRVRACNAAGCSAYTSEVSATAHPSLPGTPTLSATAVSSFSDRSQLDRGDRDRNQLSRRAQHDNRHRVCRNCISCRYGLSEHGAVSLDAVLLSSARV